MRFNPKSEKELNMANLADPGMYHFEVVSAKDTQSKKGNDMIELQLKYWDMNGKERFVYDYLLEAMSFKLLHFAETVGIEDLYESGELSAKDCLGKTGNVEIIIQPGSVNTHGGYYPDKNSVKDYLKIDSSLAASSLNSDEFLNDQIPF